MIDLILSLDPRSMVACIGIALIVVSCGFGVLLWWMTPR